MAAVVAARNETRGTVLAERLETASSLWGRFRGLMGRRSLPVGQGLLIDGTNGIHMFFMRFPIDAVFVGKPGAGVADGGDHGGAQGERIVLSVHRNLRPWTGIVPVIRGAAGVLELPVGTIEATGTAPGDRVRLG